MCTYKDSYTIVICTFLEEQSAISVTCMLEGTIYNRDIHNMSSAFVYPSMRDLVVMLLPGSACRPKHKHKLI